MNKMKDYIESIEFKEIELDELTTEEIEAIHIKEGLVICNDETTSLWIHRELSNQSFLNSTTVMESVNNFCIRDSFGVIIWEGNSESIKPYIEGFMNGEEC